MIALGLILGVLALCGWFVADVLGDLVLQRVLKVDGSLDDGSPASLASGQTEQPSLCWTVIDDLQLARLLRQAEL